MSLASSLGSGPHKSLVRAARKHLFKLRTACTVNKRVLRKSFTVSEAEALLPALRPLLEELRRHKETVDKLQEQISGAAEKSAGNGHTPGAADSGALREQAEEIANEAAALIQRISDYGCELKDIDQGLLDFPAEYQGRSIYLCWRLGEERIEWCHDIDSGFAGRRSLPQELRP